MTSADSLKGLNVLVVDDNTAFLEVVESMLVSTTEARVQKARSVGDAMSSLPSSDCVICDHGLGGKTGIELLKEIRSGGHEAVPRDLCFIVLTAHSDESLKTAAAALDANNYIVKPIRTYALLDAMSEALNRKIALKPAASYAETALPILKRR